MFQYTTRICASCGLQKYVAAPLDPVKANILKLSHSSLWLNLTLFVFSLGIYFMIWVKINMPEKCVNCNNKKSQKNYEIC